MRIARIGRGNHEQGGTIYSRGIVWGLCGLGDLPGGDVADEARGLMKRKSLYCSTYLVNVRLYYDCTFKEYKRYMKRYQKADVSVDYNEDDVQGQVTYGEKAFYVFLSREADLYFLAHECIHLVMMIFDRANVSIGMEPNKHEHFAYYTQYWIKRIWETIKNNGGSK